MGRKFRPFEPIDKEERLQKYFKTIRMATGMSASEFARTIGVTRQLINFIEAGDARVTYMTYLGVEGIVLNSHMSLLLDLWDILVDGDYTEDFRDLANKWGKIIACSYVNGVTDDEQANDAWHTILAEL